ncbi:MAG TPA: hypothetical protein VGY66_17000 [Gemmataceae bacterium]|jgi:hypothetical protein|nr:hypothetical protein [Gemmataceae bacterium]
MKVNFGQIYIEPGVNFPFSHHFQRLLSEAMTSLVTPSPEFIRKYGADFELMFNISAKRNMQDNEIKGPTVFKKTKDVEYSVFLPFDVINRSSEVPRAALSFLFRGACSVFESLGIDTVKILEKQESLIEQVCSDPMMFEGGS